MGLGTPLRKVKNLPESNPLTEIQILSSWIDRNLEVDALHPASPDLSAQGANAKTKLETEVAILHPLSVLVSWNSG